MLNKKILTIFAMLLAYSAANTITKPDDNVQIEDLDAEQACPTICPSLYAPLCSFDGAKHEEFVNECMMKLKNCHLKKERALNNLFTRTENDWCNTKLVDNLHSFLIEKKADFRKPECQKPCTMIFEPVCVSNGEYRGTIANRCLLDALNCALNGTELASKVFTVLSGQKCEQS